MLNFLQCFIQIFGDFINITMLQTAVGAPFIHFHHQPHAFVHRNG